MDCSQDDCDKPATRRGMCQAHYRQAMRRERGLKRPGPKPDPSKEHSKYRDRSQCPQGHPYGADVDARGHRICAVCAEQRKKTHCPQGHAYDEVNTYYTNGSPQCRTCRNERMRERRPSTGVGPGGINSAKTECPRGHAYTELNTYRTPDGRRLCRTCMRANSAVQNVMRYGKTPEEIEQMSQDQGHACAICRLPFGPTRQRNIDHDHACCNGAYSCGDCVRALLCSACNQGLGKFLDSAALLRAAADYLDGFVGASSV